MAQQGILSLSIKDKQALYKSYMPFVSGGGLFVPSTKKFALGDEVFLLLTVMEFEERLPIPGKVVWITPQGAAGNRKAGIGVQFADTQDAPMPGQSLNPTWRPSSRAIKTHTPCSMRAIEPAHVTVFGRFFLLC